MKYFLLQAACILVLTVACTGRPTPSDILEKARNLVNVDADSAGIILSEITEPDGLSPSEKADYGSLISQVHYKRDKAMAEDSLILYSLAYYKKTNDRKNLPLAYFLAANYYKWQENKKAFRETMQEGLPLGIENQDSVIVYFMYRELSGDAFKEKEYEQALAYLQQALPYNPYYGRPSVFYNMAILYSRMEEKDSSDFYFRKSVDLHLARGNVAAAKFCRRNYADFLKDEGEEREALSLLYQNIREYGDTTHLSLAFCYFNLRQLDSAQFYLDRLKEDRPRLNITSHNLAELLQLLIDAEKGGKIHIDDFAHYNDSVYFSILHEQKLLTEKINHKNRLEQKYLRLTVRQQQWQLYISWGILLLLITGGGVISYLHRKRKLLAETEEAREVLEHLLQEASEKNPEKNNFFKKLVLQQLGFIRIVANRPTPHNQELLKQVSLIDNPEKERDHILVWSDFYQMIDSVYKDFYTRLNTRFGDRLTEKEIQLCCLLRAGFSTKEISVLTGQKFQTIYQRKTTIRQKLGMDEKEDIVDFLSL